MILFYVIYLGYSGYLLYLLYLSYVFYYLTSCVFGYINLSHHMQTNIQERVCSHQLQYILEIPNIYFLSRLQQPNTNIPTFNFCSLLIKCLQLNATQVKCVSGEHRFGPL